MLQAEYGENIPSELATPPVGPPIDPAIKAKQMELQERIVNILNKPKPQPISHANNATLINATNQLGQAMQSSGLDNPLQRAIDNLIRTGPNLLNQVAQSSNSGAGGSGGARSGTGSNPGSGIGPNVGGDNSGYSSFGLLGNF